eukprot:490292-Amphidinium_carterae.2
MGCGSLTRAKLSGRKRWSDKSDNLCSVDWNDRQQGLAPLVERYRNSPVMHESVPEDCGPMQSQHGNWKPHNASRKDDRICCSLILETVMAGS